LNKQLFPKDIQAYILPFHNGEPIYQCLGCEKTYKLDTLLYTCPHCADLLMINDQAEEKLHKVPAAIWRKIFDYRKMLRIPALKGIYRYHEFIGPKIPLQAVVYLGEAHTPIIEANSHLQKLVGIPFYYKNDGQNPSASFKDRGMASAVSFLNFLVQSGTFSEILAICASTGDTSAAAALYSAYLHPFIKSAVLLPHKKVTPQQLAQPLGNGAAVYEIPGVFDDCMKVVEALSENYNVALLNSKNAWRILGQESYAYEIAQDFDYQLERLVVFVPIGNAGNISAVMNGFIKFFKAGILEALPKIIGVQSDHANPVFKFYVEKDEKQRQFIPQTVQPSVAQAAVIGNPVSMPRVKKLVTRYNELAGRDHVFFVSVTEQEIIEWQLKANRNGHIVCTHGGGALAGLIAAQKENLINAGEIGVLDSTAHAIKFSGFQQMYFENTFPDEYQITPDPTLANTPTLLRPEKVRHFPAPGKPLDVQNFKHFVKEVSEEIARRLNLKETNRK